MWWRADVERWSEWIALLFPSPTATSHLSFFVLSIPLLSHSFDYSLLHLLTDRVMITQSVCAICDTREEKRLLSGRERESKKRILYLSWEKANQLHTTPSFYRHTRVIFYFTTNSMIFLAKFCTEHSHVKFSNDI